MNAIRNPALLIGASLLAVALLAAPAFADVGDAFLLAAEETEADPTQGAEEAPATEEDGRLQVAEGPRDMFALLLMGALVGGGLLAWRNARRQLSGERPQASGEFRWR